VNASKQSLLSSQTALEATRAGYNVGTRNLVDVLNAERNLRRAERTYLNARYDYIINLLRLKQTAGVLNPGDVETLEQWLDSSAEIPRSRYPIL
jgi:outer membrane protein